VILVARHASVLVRGVCYGQSDVPTDLSDEEASDRLAAQLTERDIVPNRVVSSPWRRARGPAALLAARVGVPHAVDPRLSELHFGEWEGRPYAELEEEPAFGAWMRAWQTEAPPGGERLDDLLSRVREWRHEAVRNTGITIAVTHAGVIRVLRSLSLGVPYADVVSEQVAPLKIEVVAARTIAAGAEVL
jgi:alpha-ribazole phosphatase